MDPMEPALLTALGMMAPWAIMCVVVGVFFLPFRRTKTQALPITLLALAFSCAAIPTISQTLNRRKQGFERLAQRSQGLVTAIRQFEKENKRPPDNLGDLVPRFLPAVPRTGIQAYPDYRYTREATYENPWSLSVNASWGASFDQFVYLPKLNYPEFAFGGNLERIGDWAYVHE